jgi:hypothetical protein
VTSEAKILSNQANALRSTGPKTEDGKARSALNRLTHGLRSTVVVIRGEDPEEWQRFRSGIVEAFATANALETELANRVALGLWRLRRCAVLDALMAELNAESALLKAESSECGAQSFLDPRPSIKFYQREVERLSAPSPLASFLKTPPEAVISGVAAFEMMEEFCDAADANEQFDLECPAFLRSTSVPDEWIKQPSKWKGWTAKLVRTGLEKMATEWEVDLDEILENASTSRDERRVKAEQSVAKYSRDLEIAERAAGAATLRKL